MNEELEHNRATLTEVQSELERRGDRRSLDEAAALSWIIGRLDMVAKGKGARECATVLCEDIDALTEELRNRGDHASLMEAYALAIASNELSFLLFEGKQS